MNIVLHVHPSKTGRCGPLSRSCGTPCLLACATYPRMLAHIPRPTHHTSIVIATTHARLLSVPTFLISSVLLTFMYEKQTCHPRLRSEVSVFLLCLAAFSYIGASLLTVMLCQYRSG